RSHNTPRVQRLSRRTGQARQGTPDPMTEAPTTPVETIRKALLGCRVMAWTTGIWLIALCYEMVLKYIVQVDNPPNWIAIVHGWVYFVYLVLTANLAGEVRWAVGQILCV